MAYAEEKFLRFLSRQWIFSMSILTLIFSDDLKMATENNNENGQPKGASKKGKEEAFAYKKPKRSLFRALLNPIKFLSVASQNQFINDGYNLMREGNHKHAISAFKTALRENPNCVDAYVGMGKATAALGGINNSKMAIQLFQKALTLDFARFEVYDEMIVVYERLGDKKRANAERRKRYTARALKQTPENPIANNNMGVLQLQLNNLDEAIRYFRKAIHYDDKVGVSQFNLAKALFKKASDPKHENESKDILKKAATELEKTLNANVTAEALLLKSKIFLQYGELETALEICDAAYNLDPSMKEAYATKRVIEEKMGNLEQATHAYDTYKSLEKAEKETKK